MKLSNNWLKLVILADRKSYEVKAIVKTDAEANTFIATHPTTSVIDTDDAGFIYIAENTPLNKIS